MKKYTGESRQEISFPLGGIGTGCIGLDGTGRLVDWEIFNHPDKGTLNGFSHFGIKAEDDSRVLDARVMAGDLIGSLMGRYVESPGHHGYGYGPSRYLLCGVPHFRDSVFYGEFPSARVEWMDETFPGEVSLSAFNPFIPSNDLDSSLPTAFFTARVLNSTDNAINYTLELTVNNPSKYAHVHKSIGSEHFVGVLLDNTMKDVAHPDYGQIVFGVPQDDAPHIQRYWYRGNWFDNLSIFWQDFTCFGPIRDRDYPTTVSPDDKVYEDLATVSVTRRLLPGEVWEQRFLIGWYYPNYLNYWSERGFDRNDPQETANRSWKNYYATLFDGAADVAEYSMREWDRLQRETDTFRAALYGSNLPEAAMEAVGANLAVLKSPTVLRLPNGEFYGWEGCSSHEGSCEGSCTHVWNYAQALPFLFPGLERSMRELDYRYNQRDDGGMPFRLQLPLGKERSSFRPCVDGQMGGIIKTYREWKLSGDDEWLKRIWPLVRKSLEFAWAPTNADLWDPDMNGVITGRQHHTLDMELFGPNAWLNGFYAGALKAASEMADAVGEREAAALYRSLYEKCRAFTDKELFNGEYYIQKVDINDKSLLQPYAAGDTLTGGSTLETYWSDEAGQIKYQIGDGCIVDQVLAQWLCEIAGVGEILDQEHVKSALGAIYRYNFKPSLRTHFNPCRIYGADDESGLTICDWPAGAHKPVVPIPYAEECMHGFEYQAAVHMIRYGMVDEGLRVVRGIRDRYDGRRRNPWNEMECGSNYARSMASYALLLAFSGFSYDMRKGMLGFAPLRDGAYFWSADGAWGTYCRDCETATFSVLYGRLSLSSLKLDGVKAENVRLGGKKLECVGSDGNFTFTSRITISEGECISFE